MHPCFISRAALRSPNQQYNLNTTINNVGLASADRSGWGGTVGVGWEYGFSPNWTAGIEYDYIWRTNDTRTFLTPGLTVGTGSLVPSPFRQHQGRCQYGHGAYQLSLRRTVRASLLI